jgi:hypothetical protein
MRGADKPTANYIPVKIFGIYFNVEMINNTAKGHDG